MKTKSQKRYFRPILQLIWFILKAAVYAFPIDVGNTNNVQNIMLVAIKNPDTRYYTKDDIRILQQQQQSQVIPSSINENNNNNDDNEFPSH